MKEIAIQDLNNLKELDNFINDTNKKALTIKGIVVANYGDIKEISADIKELKEREYTLKIAEGRLIKLSGIDRVGIAIDNSCKQRLLANKNVQNAKQEIKNKALDFFTLNADELIKNSKASDTYKQTFNVKKMAQETIFGKSKNFMDLMKTELGNLKLRLDNNARETREKLAIINNFNKNIVGDKETLLQMPVDSLNQTLINREHEYEQIIEQKAAKLADEIEAERIAQIKIETEKLEAAKLADEIEAERIAQIKIETEKLADEIEAERIAQIKIETEKLADEIEAERVETPDLAPVVKYKIFLTIKPPKKGMAIKLEIPNFGSNSNSEKQKSKILKMFSKAKISFEKK